MERRYTKGQDEEKHSQREVIGFLSIAWLHPRFMDFRGHVEGSPDCFSNQTLRVLRKTEVAKFDLAFVSDQNILQLEIHVGVPSLIVECIQC